MESSGKLNSNGLNLEWDGSIKPVKKGKKTQRVLFNIKNNKKHTKVDLEITPNDDATIDLLGDVTTTVGKKTTKKHYDLKHFNYKSTMPTMQRMTPMVI